MKHIFSALLMLLTASVASAAPSQLAARGDQAYSEKDYASAAEFYNQALDAEGASSDLFYNLGNTYYRLGNKPQAIIAYERALKLDPTNSDARENLAFVNEQIIDKTGDTSSYSTLFIDKAMQTMDADSWAVISILLFVVVIGLAAGYVFSSGVRLRKICFFSGIVVLLLTVGSVIITMAVKSKMTSSSEAIVTAVSTQLSTTPSTPVNTTQQAFLLHEGCKVHIMDSVATPMDPVAKLWYEVTVDDSHRAWINADDVEII